MPVAPTVWPGLSWQNDSDTMSVPWLYSGLTVMWVKGQDGGDGFLWGGF